MSPREFFNAYGLPKARVIESTGADQLLAPMNPDRYCLQFLSILGTWQIYPFLTGQYEGVKLQLAETAELIYVHTLHGSLVNAEWHGVGGAAQFIMVIEGIMIDSSEKSMKERFSDAQRTTNNHPLTVNRGGERNSIAKRRK